MPIRELVLGGLVIHVLSEDTQEVVFSDLLAYFKGLFPRLGHDGVVSETASLAAVADEVVHFKCGEPKQPSSFCATGYNVDSKTQPGKVSIQVMPLFSTTMRRAYCIGQPACVHLSVCP
jgi:hypothetical protein